MEQKVIWVDVESSNIERIAYDIDARVLAVQFKNGSIYSYSNVDQDIFNAMQTVPSVGRYFNMMIKVYHDYNKWSSELELVNYISTLKENQAA